MKDSTKITLWSAGVVFVIYQMYKLVCDIDKLNEEIAKGTKGALDKIKDDAMRRSTENIGKDLKIVVPAIVDASLETFIKNNPKPKIEGDPSAQQVKFYQECEAKLQQALGRSPLNNEIADDLHWHNKDVRIVAEFLAKQKH